MFKAEDGWSGFPDNNIVRLSSRFITCLLHYFNTYQGNNFPVRHGEGAINALACLISIFFPLDCQLLLIMSPKSAGAGMRTHLKTKTFTIITNYEGTG